MARPVVRLLCLLATFAAAKAIAAAPQPEPPKLRLPDAVAPVRYAAELKIVPSAETFTGSIDIDVEVKKATPLVWLNADELEVTQAEALVNGQVRAARIVRAARDFVGLAFDAALPKGKARLKLLYTAKLSRKDSSGASAQREGDDWYVFTHFEPIDARRVFPCFDEPGYKVPWQLTIVTKTSERAFANTPVAEEKELGDGWKKVRFAESKPLPSYLIAFAVGPFDVVDAGKSRVSGTPVRIITLKGQAEQARWAKESSAELLARLEEYFGSNYPYEKLDNIAVPLFGGAMENPGLVTFSTQLILRRPSEETVSSRRAYASVAVHEFAHQWFGDLVTMAWWDDLWLNEAFATWMTPKIVEAWQPGWGAAEGRVGTRNQAMSADSLVSARKIRQPILTNDDMKNAFDGITYGKGASVIHMFERWIGPEVFRRGVQRHLKAHAHGNATAKDFLAAVSAEAGRDIAPAFATFLDQAGVPLVSMKLSCEGGAGRLTLAQERYLPEGSTGAAQQTWQVPVCVRFGHGKLDGRACMLLGRAEDTLPLPSCPDRLLPNDGAAGYYRARVEGPELERLLEDGGKALSPGERLGVVGDLVALARAGKMPYAGALKLVPKLAGDGSRHVVQATAGLVSWLRDGQLVPDALRPAYAKFIRDTFGARARKLGWTPKKGEDEDAKLLRLTLVPLVANQGEDAKLAAEAKKLTGAWLKDHKAVPTDIAEAAFGVTAERGDKALFEVWAAAARKEKDRLARRLILHALGRFRDPEVVSEGLKLTLDPAVEIREATAILWGATRAPETRPVAYAFVKQRFDALVERLPRDGGANLPLLASAMCDEAMVADVEAFFAERSTKFTGGPRVLKQALESMRLCATFNKRQGPGIAEFFQSLKK